MYVEFEDLYDLPEGAAGVKRSRLCFQKRCRHPIRARTRHRIKSIAAMRFSGLRSAETPVARPVLIQQRQNFGQFPPNLWQRVRAEQFPLFYLRFAHGREERLPSPLDRELLTVE